MKIALRAAVAAVCLLAAGSARAQSLSVITACRGDAERLCDCCSFSDVLNHSRVRACMRAKWPQVSVACKQAVAASERK